MITLRGVFTHKQEQLDLTGFKITIVYEDNEPCEIQMSPKRFRGLFGGCVISGPGVIVFPQPFRKPYSQFRQVHNPNRSTAIRIFIDNKPATFEDLTTYLISFIPT